MSKVSILVAVYNAETYLSTCLDSLLGQTESDIQIICVDDASTDSSWKILTDYAARDSRICLLRMEQNSGQAKARNRGLQLADGEWIAMVDSDDWLSPDALEQVLNTAEQHPEASAIMFKLMQVWPDGTQELYKNRPDKSEYSATEAFRLSLNWSLHGLYVIKAELHKRYPFDDTCRLYSDDNTTHIHYLHAGKVCVSNGIYYYRKHNNSCTSAISIWRFDFLEANLSMKRTLEAENADTAILNFYEYHRWLNYVGCYQFFLRHRKAFTPQEQASVLQRLRNTLTTFERNRLPMNKCLKMGYFPFANFTLFRGEEFFYFHLRELLKKNKH